MADALPLLIAVLADPADDTARLVLADLLRESEDPEAQARGRFLWAGVVAGRFRDHDLIDDPFYYTAQREISAVAGSGWPARWLADIGPGSAPLAAGDWAWDATFDRVTVRVGSAAGVFTRGMLAELTVPLDAWIAASPLALASWPVEVTRAADVPGLTFAIEPPGPGHAGWRLAARLRLPRRLVPLTGGGIIPGAVAPRPVLAEEPADWQVAEEFADREALVAGVAEATASLVAELRGVAGDRWPLPPRRR